MVEVILNSKLIHPQHSVAIWTRVVVVGMYSFTQTHDTIGILESKTATREMTTNKTACSKFKRLPLRT